MKEEPRARPPQAGPHDGRRYLVGIVISVLCAASVAAASLIAVAGRHNEALLGVLIALYVCLPLLALLLMAWLVYAIRDRGHMPAWAHGWLWLPTLAAALIVPASAALDDWRESRRDEAFPPVSELHVNLSGRELWIPTRRVSTHGGGSPDLPMPAGQPGIFVELTRWAGDAQSLPNPMFPYSKGRLLPEFDRLPRLLGEGPDSAQGWPQDDRAYAPWTLSNPMPSVEAFKPYVRYFSVGSLVEYVYYHYPDRIEIAPVMRDPSDLQDLPADALPVPLVGFNAVNMTNEQIVRLEVNGQAVRIGAWGKAVAPMRDCRRGHARLGVAQLSLDGPLLLRWQTGRAPHAWQQASVPLPKLEGVLPDGAQPRRQQVLLYFDENGQVLAERFQEVELAGKGLDGSMALRLTGAPEGLSRPPPCQSALDSYDHGRVFVLPPPG